jgi:hypothetical protein
MPDTLTLHPWLKGFLPHQRPLVSTWFSYGLSQGCRTPESLVQLVGRLVASKLEWSVSPTSIQLCETTLAALAHRRREALSYAQTLLEQAPSGPRAA